MPTRTHRILAAFLALWMPFCCCQVRAAAQALADAATDDASIATHRAPACCGDAPRADACCAGESHGSDASHGKGGGCCDPDEGGPTDRAPGADCCTSCKERTTSPAAPVIVHADTIGVDLPPTIGQPALVPAAEDLGRGTTRGHHTGPPPRPAGREALALHSILLD